LLVLRRSTLLVTLYVEITHSVLFYFHQVIDCSFQAAKSGGSAGQHLTKVDRSDDIVKPKTVGQDVANAIKNRRNEEPYKMTQKELAAKCNTTATVIQEMEKGTATPDQKVLSTMERVLKIRLRGSKIGEELFAKKK